MGLGLVFVSYFLNIIANLTEDLEFIKYITPFGYADGAYIISEKAIDIKYLAIGILFSVIGIVAAFLKYSKKDIT